MPKISKTNLICDKGDNCPHNSKANEFDPSTNPKAISIIEQPDGNWMGWTQRFGKLIEVREISPNDCLVKLLTHDGQAN